jgi:hypothetical protein
MTDVSTGRQLSATKQALLAQRLRGPGAVATIRARRRTRSRWHCGRAERPRSVREAMSARPGEGATEP